MTAPGKRIPASVLQRARMLVPILVILMIGAIFLQRPIDAEQKGLHKQEIGIPTAAGGLNNEFLLLPLLGFREAAAGLLWVRADEFFHSGDYDSILPLVRLITWLDPHAENVYVTGAWHLSYNFTDSSERSDRRYIPPALKLLDEGIANNMNIPDIKFEKGWEEYDKVKDFPNAIAAYNLVLSTPRYKGSDDYPYGYPLRMVHALAHAYEKAGQLPEALDTWKFAMNRCNEQLAAYTDTTTPPYALKQLLAAEKHNYSEALQRYYDRYTTANHSAINPTKYPAVLQPGEGGTTPGPWDVAFHPQVEITRPKVIKVSGELTATDGARVDVRIADEDYQAKDVSTTLNTFEVDPEQTILMDSLSVKKTKFGRELDMSHDPKMYNFSKPWLNVVVSYNPRTTSPFLQDRFGWSGEGITDHDPARVYTDPRPEMRGTKLIDNPSGEGPNWDGKNEKWFVHGQSPRIIKVTFRVSREDILKGGKTLTDKDIVPNK